jgi:8-oxo-dGTP diphosphatase
MWGVAAWRRRHLDGGSEGRARHRRSASHALRLTAAPVATTFCSNCGARLDEEPPTTCAACGVDHYRNPKPCGGALLVHGGRVLLVRRAIEPYLGAWDIPGGFCDLREHPRETAERELFEETGVRGRAVRLVGMWLDDYTGGEVCLNIYYEMEPAGEPRPSAASSEVAELRWFAPDELPLGDISFPGHSREVLEAWRQSVS